MTPRYRCPWCDHTMVGMKASALLRKHVLERHRALLIKGLGILESFTPRKPLDPPRTAAKRPRTFQEGVSGEGDS